MPLESLLIEELLSEVGLVGMFMLWVMYQVYSPEQLPDTKLQASIRGIEQELTETRHLLVSTITVIRAMVRTNPKVDTEQVDEYLVENGVEPADFITSNKTKTETEIREELRRNDSD